MSAARVVRVGHSPDPDDAFMVWALAEGIVHADDFDVELVPRDIETLNEWAVADARLEATALSAATFARVADRYWLLPHGASFGDGYGPVVVARDAREPVRDVLCPGELTTAHAALHLAVPRVACRHVPFDRILPAVREGKAPAGVLIHEGQLTWEREGLHRLLDLGAWWKGETGLPLPLGVVALRKDLGRELGEDANALLRASLETGLAQRTRALAYAMRFGRGLAVEDADEFVRRYVNGMTRDMGERGLAAIGELARRAGAAGLLPRGVRVEMAP